MNKDAWSIGRAGASCAACGTAMEPGRICWATLNELPPTADHVPAPEPEAGASAEAGAAPEVGPQPEAAAPQATASDATAAPAKPEEAAQAKSPFQRLDFCEACWAAGKRPAAPLEMFSFWKTTVPEPTQKRKLLVDDSVLMDLFTRLEDKTEPQDVRFRFVLALILMRKRLLKYEGSRALSAEPNAPEEWDMIPRGTEAHVKVINPQLATDQIAEVSQQLSQILAEEI